jgi:hypothetical protein
VWTGPVFGFSVASGTALLCTEGAATLPGTTMKAGRRTHHVVVNSGSFSVNGIPVDASRANFVTSQTSLAPGVFASVQGRMAGGTLIATQVTLLTQSDIDARVFQVTGAVSGWNATAKTFTVRNVEVDYSAAAFVNGTAAGLANGVAVRVEGTPSVDGSQIRATQITLR